MVQKANDQNQRKLQIMIDHQLNASQKKVAEIVKNSNSNKVRTLKSNETFIHVNLKYSIFI